MNCGNDWTSPRIANVVGVMPFGGFTVAANSNARPFTPRPGMPNASCQAPFVAFTLMAMPNVDGAV